MSNITPAPWAVHNSMLDCVTFEGQHGQENLFLMNIDGYYACQNEADARLIAAAPDLLAALQNMIGAFHSPIARRKLPSDFNVEAIESAQAAIAKATGESL